MKKKNQSVCIIGFGKVGSAFAFALKDSGYNINYIISNQFVNKNKLLRKFPKCKFDYKIKESSVCESDIILISVQDSKLVNVVDKIAKLKIKLSDKMFFHTSGVLTSDVFKKMKSDKICIGSMHPVQTFNNLSLKNKGLLKKIYFGIEGDKNSINLFKKLCREFGSECIEIDKKDKTLYHVACVMSSNFLVAHIYLLEMLFKKVCDDDALKIFMPIIETTLDNLSDYGVTGSLTGPVSRNDIKTVEKHINCLEKYESGILNYYIMMSDKIIGIARKQGSINIKQAGELRKILKKYSN